MPIEALTTVILLPMIFIGIPVGFILLIYVLIKKLIKYNADCKNQQPKITNEDRHQKPFTQADFERWKQDKGGFIDLDAEISLSWRRAT